MGLIYVIHFDSPFHHARHYIGWTQENVFKRLKRHKSGDGSKLLRAVNKAGIGYCIVRIIPGDRSLERRIKNRKNSKDFCPLCSDNPVKV